MKNYDAVLFLSFGGPEGMADVMPFLANVLRGKNVPEARMKEVAHHYERFGGVSPINEQNRQLIAALESELKLRSISLPIYWGNRNWHPLLTDTLRQMKEVGIKRVLTFVTSAYSSYSGCRQYLEDIEKAKVEAEAEDLQIDKIPVYYKHPLFVLANIEHVKAGLETFPVQNRSQVHVAFTAHSIPMAMADNCDYVKQLQENCDKVASELGITDYKLVYQSRSGPAAQPWLEPDILDHMRTLVEQGTKNVLVHPIGFISDHMEILYDLDTEAKDLAGELGMQFVRTSTAGTNANFVKMMGDMVEERLRSTNVADNSDKCAPGCCAYTPVRPPSIGNAGRS